MTSGGEPGAAAAPPAAAAPSAPSAAPQSHRAPHRPDTGPPTVLLLVRHGRTAMTEAGRFSGSGGAQDPELSAAGRDDAARVAARVAAVDGGPLLGGRPISAVVASPLRRTRQTAAAIAEPLGLDVAQAPGWAEAAFGVWDGLTYAEIARQWPDLLSAWQGSTTLAPPGGESLDDFCARVGEARRATLAEYAGQVVVVVSHATPVRATVQHALDAGPAALWRISVAPASLTGVRYWSDGGTELITVNATEHLTPAVR